MPRVIPHFKVRLSLRNHDEWIGVYDDDALLAMRTRIGMMAVERFADRTGDSFLASNADLCSLANATPVSNAIKKLRRLCRAGDGLEPSRTEAASKLELSREGAWWRLTYPKFASEQGFSGKNGVETVPSSASASAATSTKEQEKNEEPAASAAAPSVNPPERTLDPDPEKPGVDVPDRPTLALVEPLKKPRKPRANDRTPMPIDFPDAALRAALAGEFADLALDDAIAEFLSYAERDRVTYKGDVGWRAALRNALLRDRGRGLFPVHRAQASPARAPGARIPSRAEWDQYAARTT